MSKRRDEFCKAIKKQYPCISAKSDIEYCELWGDFTNSEYYSYSWFEALAKVLNREMCSDVSASEYSDLLNTISANFVSGDEAIKKCIDVAFVENLFWQVPRFKTERYWESLPNNLKVLYINFHHGTPL